MEPHILKLERENYMQKAILENHKITEEYRAKMVDWQIEVIDKLENHWNVLFLSVNVMDRYYKHLC